MCHSNVIWDLNFNELHILRLYWNVRTMTLCRQLPSLSSKVTWIEMLKETNPVPHVELLNISHRKCTSLSNTVRWYLILLIIDISPMDFDDISFTFSCILMFVHVTLLCFLTHQFIGFSDSNCKTNSLTTEILTQYYKQKNH